MPSTKAYWVLNMNREFVLGLCKERYGTEPDYPFNDKYNSAVLRHSDTRKWYGIILNVSPRVFGLLGDEKVDVINLKIDPLMMGSFYRKKEFFLPIICQKLVGYLLCLTDLSAKKRCLF